ncbi:serine/threonine protein kinase, partial [Acidobacteriota bacterium]
MNGLFAVKYKILKSLGEGGFFEVFLADDLENGSKAALKIARDDRGKEKLEQEYRFHARIDHPNIARALDFGEDKGKRAFLALEYVDGTALSENEDLNEDLGMLSRAVVQILLALRSIHARGLIHGDIKPTNILLIRSPDSMSRHGIKIIDPSGDPGKGTFKFMAPEALRGENADYRADFYALGVTLYYILSGRYPVEGADPKELFERMHRESVPDLRTTPGNEPAPWSPFVKRLLAFDPKDRFGSAEEALAQVPGYGGLKNLPADHVLIETPHPGCEEALDEIKNWLDAPAIFEILLIETRDRISANWCQRQGRAEVQLVGGAYVDLGRILERSPDPDVAIEEILGLFGKGRHVDNGVLLSGEKRNITLKTALSIEIRPIICVLS